METPGRKGLPNNSVQSLLRDSNGRVMVGTNGGGVSLFRTSDSTFTHFNTSHGLPSNTIYSMVGDERDDMWIATSSGLVRAIFDGDNFWVKNIYDPSDGLQGSEFFRGAGFRANDGTLYFGGSNGFNAFNPLAIDRNSIPPPVYITGFALFNRPMRVNEEGSLLSKHITKLKSLTLNHNHSVITFTYTALNYTNSHRNSYAYYLEPFESEWNYVGGRREATYTNLDPGRYTLRVKASNNDGVWNHEGTSLEIIVLPPWWMTWWARTLAILIVANAIFWLYKLRMRFLKKQKEQLQKLIFERTRELDSANQALLYKQQEIVQQNEEISQQNEEIIAQYEEIQVQKNMVEEKNTVLQELNNELNLYRTNLESIVEERTFELLEEKHRAEESDRLKTSFLNNMSHEIRTPLNAIIGFSDIVCSPEFEQDEKKSSVEVIRHNCDYLLQLIEDIIDISRIETGQIQINPKPIALSDVILDIEKIVNSGSQVFKSIRESNVAFSTSIPDSLASRTIESDPRRLKQIFFHLIENAFKYTKRGFVEVGCRAHNDDEVVFFVRDSGIGIKSDNLEKIFSRFIKIEEDQSTLHRGAGIGLTLTKPLVELLKGRIWVDSVFQHGTIFSFTQPLCKATIETSKNSDSTKIGSKELQGLVIMIVEDEVSNMFLLENFLKKRKVKVYKCWNGLEATELIRRHDDINLILMDIKMPVMNGYEALEIIRQTHPNIPVIAQTALVMADEIDRIERMGFNDYITKPISYNFLYEKLVPFKPRL